MIELPLAWLLTIIGVLATTIATMAAIMWGFMKTRLDAQDTIIQTQAETIAKLQDDVERMAKGCGADGCHWISGRR